MRVFTVADAARSALRRIDRTSSRIARDESKGRHVGSVCIPDVVSAMFVGSTSHVQRPMLLLFLLFTQYYTRNNTISSI